VSELTEPPSDADNGNRGKSAAGSDEAVAERAWSELLRQIIELSTEERNLRQVVRRVAEFVVATTRADVCFVHLVDSDAHQIVLMGATPGQFDELAGTIRLSFGEGVAGWVAQHAKPAVVRDKWSDPRYVYIPALKGEEFNSMISVPLLRPQGVVVGVLNVHSRNADHFQPGDATHLGEVASVLAGIVENAVLYDRLASREAEVERFAAQIIELQELDRRRIAANIHDGISQRLVSAWYHVRAARALLLASGAGQGSQPASGAGSQPAGEPRSEPDDGLARDRAVVVELETTEALLTDAMDEARNAIVGLRPAILDDLGLTAGLTSLASSLGSDAEIELDLESSNLAAHVETALYRISQEALQNVMKHAQAQHVRIGLHEGADGRVVLAISDDGVGFEPSQFAGRLSPSSVSASSLLAGTVSYGLQGMQERAALIGAHLEVRSRVGEGTAVIVTVPTGAGSEPGLGQVSPEGPGDPLR
jgi:two-component system, NarL family, sensor kinase